MQKKQGIKVKQLKYGVKQLKYDKTVRIWGETVICIK